MKKIILPLIMAIAGIANMASAQTIPNAGLESWAIDTGTFTESPTGGWYALNLGPGFATVTKSTDKQQGNYSAKLAPLDLGGQAIPGLLQMTIPTTMVAKYLNFYCKATLDPATDTLIVYLSSNDTVGNGGTGGFQKTSIASWTPFYIDLISLEGTTYDSVSFGVVLMGANNPVVYVDNFSFSNTPIGSSFGTPVMNGIKDILSPNKNKLEATIYPNPAKENTNINFTLNKSDNVQITIKDVAGKTVKTIKNEWMSSGNQTVSFDGTDFGAGIYFVMIQTGQYSTTKKLIINR